MKDQALNQHRSDYELPSPNHRDPFKEWMELHFQWNEKSANIIKEPFPEQALHATLGALSYSNDTFRKNVVPSVKHPFLKSVATRALHQHNSRELDKLFSSAKTSPTQNHKAYMAMVITGDSSSQIAPQHPGAPSQPSTGSPPSSAHPSDLRGANE